MGFEALKSSKRVYLYFVLCRGYPDVGWLGNSPDETRKTERKSVEQFLRTKVANASLKFDPVRVRQIFRAATSIERALIDLVSIEAG